MHLYHLTLQRPSNIRTAVYGSFTAPKKHEIAVASGPFLQILTPDRNGKLSCIASANCFGTIRDLHPFRIMGTKRDYLLLGSDSGKLVILQVNLGNTPRTGTSQTDQQDRQQQQKSAVPTSSSSYSPFKIIHEETFGKSGCRRIVPGQYVAADPKGRACMIAAVEKQKFVYVLNRDNNENLTISSPLEAHKNHAITSVLTALDVGFQNPVFATLEALYNEANTAQGTVSKLLVYYELDLCLNNVVRKIAVPVDSSAYKIVPIPGGKDGPSGLLLCSDGKITYRSSFPTRLDHTDPNATNNVNSITGDGISALLPYRASQTNENYKHRASPMIVAATAHKQKNIFFFILCTELGDLIKVDLKWHEDQVSQLVLSYFDTLPSPAISLSVLRTGFLFAASEFNDHHFYQFKGIGDDIDLQSSEGVSMTSLQQAVSGENTKGQDGLRAFTPRSEPQNILLVDIIESLAPVLSLVTNSTYTSQQQHHERLYLSCGTDENATIRTLQRGFAVTELASSFLPGLPTAIFTLKTELQDDVHSFIVVSFVNATLVLRLGETVEEVTDTGFLSNVPTLVAMLMADGSFLQIYPQAIRTIRTTTAASVSEWKPPTNHTIIAACANQYQIVVALSSNEFMYFELDMDSASLIEVQALQIPTSQPDAASRIDENAPTAAALPVACISEPPENSTRGAFVGVATQSSSVARLYHVDTKQSTLRPIAIENLSANVSSLSFITCPFSGALYWILGSVSGIVTIVSIDKLTGQIVDKRSKFLGVKPVKLQNTYFTNLNAALAFSSTSYVLYPTLSGAIDTAPLCCDPMSSATALLSDQCADGLVGICGHDLKIMSLEGYGAESPLQASSKDRTHHQAVFSVSRTINLKATPRKIIRVGPPAMNLGLVVETSKKHVETSHVKKSSVIYHSAVRLIVFNRSPKQDENEEEQDEQEEEESGLTIQRIEFSEHEYAVSACQLVFWDRPNDIYMCIGMAHELSSLTATSNGVNEAPRTSSGSTSGEIRLFHLEANENETKLTYIYSTKIDAIPYAMENFHGRLLVGAGRTVRMYEAGAKQLLRKCELRNVVPRQISCMTSVGERIFVGDVQESVFLIKYKASTNRFYLVAMDTVPRWMTCLCILDYSTVVGGDKFGNVFVLRCPLELMNEFEDEVLVNGTSMNNSNTLVQEACIHVGCIVKSLCKVSLSGPGGPECILYVTIDGCIGAITSLPFKSDADVLQQLEIQVRDNINTVCGSDHLSYRSSFYPVKNIVDGDLCELYRTLEHQKQVEIAERVDREPGDVFRKLEDLRNCIL